MIPSEGARWWTFDFHTHTPASEDYGKGPNQAELKRRTPREWLLDFMAGGIDCVAVTDHNSGAWIDPLKEELVRLETEQPAGYRPIALFPGVEISANNGIHVLGIFDPSATTAKISALLGAVRFGGSFGACAVNATESAENVVDAIAEAGGLAILAHADGPRGAFSIAGGTLGPLLGNANLHAVEIVDQNCSRPDLYLKRKPALPEVIGSDAHHPSGPTGSAYPGSRFSHVKMGRPTLSGLRLALVDGINFSIRRSDSLAAGEDPNRPPSDWIRSLEIADSMFMGRGKPQALQFSPWLTALVGGRGTGKSSIAHFLRVLFRREDELALLSAGYPPRQTYEEFMRVPQSRQEQGALLANTTLRLELMHEGAAFRIDWSAANRQQVVYELNESTRAWELASSQDVRRRFPVTIFSQNQINSLSMSEGDSLVRLIDEACDAGRIHDEIERLSLELYSQFSQRRQYSSEIKKIDAFRGDLEDLTKKIARLDQSENATVLKMYRLRLDQSAAVDSMRADIQRKQMALDEVKLSFESSRLLDHSFPPEDVVGADFLAGLDAELAPARAVLETAIVQASSHLDRANAYLQESSQATALLTEVERAQADYRKLTGELPHDGLGDSWDYEALVRRRRFVEEELAKFKAIEEQIEKLDNSISTKLSDLLVRRRDLSKTRVTFLAHTLKANRFVRIQLRPYGKSGISAEQSFREMLGAGDDRFKADIFDTGEQSSRGILGNLWRITGDGPVESEPQLEDRQARVETYIAQVKASLVRAATTEETDFGGHFTNFLRRELGRRPEFLDRLLTWLPEDAIEIEYSPKGDGKNYRPIAQGSSGQKAAAILAFLLAYGNEPIVIDQPEDDLDNQLIYDLLVQQIRTRKSVRQIIAITHNPNIVVNGDAELIHVFGFAGGQCRSSSSGCLQDLDVRDSVCQIMEGGQDAFERRYKRLGQRSELG